MENIVITDAKKRIDKVVSEYRNSVGKAAFTIRVKDKYRMDFRHMVVYMFILVFSILMYKIMFIPSIVSGFVALIGIMASLTPYYFDKFKEKIWTDDYITEFDLFYLCEHEHWIGPYISIHFLSLNPLLVRRRRYSRGERYPSALCGCHSL